MNVKNSKQKLNKSRTDWKRVDAMTDDDTDTSDIPPLDKSFFTNAKLRMPQSKATVTIRLDRDILNWFKSFGKGYQTRINAVLRTYKEAHKS